MDKRTIALLIIVTVTIACVLLSFFSIKNRVTIDEIKKTNIEVDDKTMNDIIEILNNNDVSSWNGFDKVDKNDLEKLIK